MERQNANKTRDRFTRAYILRISLGIMVVLVTAVCTKLYFQQEREYQRLQLEQEELERRIESLYYEYEDLNRQYAKLDTDEYIEGIARDYLYMLHPNEILIIDK